MTQLYTSPAPATSGTHRPTRQLLLAAWGIFTLGAVGFVAFLGTNAPFADEWNRVPVYLGDEPASEWVWQREHNVRAPLPRILALACFRQTQDFRVIGILQVAILAMLALILMRFADELRGKPHWADAFFPVSLLHVGHWELFLTGLRVNTVFFVLFAILLVRIAFRATRENAHRSGVSASCVLMLLALTGGSGVAAVPVVAVWLLSLGVFAWRNDKRLQAAVICGFALLAGISATLELVNAGEFANTVVLSLSAPFGAGVAGVFALCGLCAIIVITIQLIARQSIMRPPGIALAGVFAVTVGTVCASGVFSGWILLAMCYLLWAKSGRKWVTIAICMVAALAFPANTGTGIANAARVMNDYTLAIVRLEQGVPAERLAQPESVLLSPFQADGPAIERGIARLREAGISVFAGVKR